MIPDKQIKKEFKITASKNPEKYYAVGVLKKEGFVRKQCKCGTFFWTTTDRKVCGDPACSGGFQFLDGTPAKKKLDYIQVWQEFARLFKKWGYTPIDRYPVVARWRDDTDFVQASIYDFQPYVVSGEVKPPANPLVVPQFCLRFNDIDNVGITGAHYTGFVMIGQHMFVPKEKWDQSKVFSDIHNWLKVGLGLPNDEITFHEDAWAGGGNFGPCMEYFSRGLELGNQVYMLYQQTPSGNKELPLKVLDMGMGHERNAWFTMGKATSYETTFPTVVKKLNELIGIKYDKEIIKKFLPYSSYLNIDEVDDVEKEWDKIAKAISIDKKELKNTVLPLAALYSVAEHSRALLVALSDGALPSNVGGGYNLRVILRRALSFIDKYGWKVEMPKLAELHAAYLKPLFPELSKNLGDVSQILEVERKKYFATKEKSKQIISRIIDKKVTENDLLKLYDSNGIPPEMIAEEAAKRGKEIVVPENFYAKITELHDKAEQETATTKEEEVDLDDVDVSLAEYFDDYSKTEFTAKVLKVKDNKVILDRTLFYPTSGGQIHDNGTIDGKEVVDVVKQASHIIHVVKEKHSFKKGDTVKGSVDLERRKQLAQHHTATHIVNAAARKVLGSHVNQAGAKKTEQKAHLDISHYESLSNDVMRKIESEANKIVKNAINVTSSFMSRDAAEKKYGMSIYQGGAVPGKQLRIVDIVGIDVECCGGTHLSNTKQAGKIKLVKSTKISDSIVRIEFKAGKAAEKEEENKGALAANVAKLLGVKEQQIPGRCQELFDMWKKSVKKGKKVGTKEYELSSTAVFDGNAIEEAAKILRTQPEHVAKTVSRFMKELEESKAKLK